MVLSGFIENIHTKCRIDYGNALFIQMLIAGILNYARSNDIKRCAARAPQRHKMRRFIIVFAGKVTCFFF